MENLMPKQNSTTESSAASSKPELLVSSLLHLMSHYTLQSADPQQQGACLKLASVIERHLHILSDLSNLPPVLRATCQQLSEQWADLIQLKLEAQNRKPLANRLFPRAI
jgi:hypothetical protein